MEEKGRREDGSSSRGTDWEVVSLTASAYAAAPGPKGFVPSDEVKDGSFDGKEEASSDAMMKSGHFVIAESEGENVIVKPDHREIVSEVGGQEVGDRTGEDNEVDLKRESGDLPRGTEFFDKGKSVADDNVEFGEDEKLQELASAEEEKIMYGDLKSGASSMETDMSQSGMCGDIPGALESDDSPFRNLESPVGYSNDVKPNEENKDDGAGPPCGDWWKKQAISLYSHVKEVNKLWSVVVAAAVVGLVIWGQRWRKDKVQLQQLKWQPSINKERINQMEGPIHRLKGVLVGSNQRGPWIRAHSSN